MHPVSVPDACRQCILLRRLAATDTKSLYKQGGGGSEVVVVVIRR